MTRPAAIQADYCNFRRIRGRRVLVLEVEVPLEREREVFDVLGFPDPATGCPVAIAPLAFDAQEDQPEQQQKPRKRWQDLSRAQQAGIRCGEERFVRFLHHRGWQHDLNPERIAQAVRVECEVTSRAELDTDPDAAARWDAIDAEYRRWAGLDAEPR